MFSYPVSSLAFIFSSTVVGQSSYYWVNFWDKENCGFSLERPQEFLYERAIIKKAGKGD